MITTTTTTPTSAPVLLALLGNLYADALCAGPCGLQALSSFIASPESGFNAGVTAKEGLRVVLDGLTRMEPRLEEQGVETRVLSKLMLEVSEDTSDETVAIGRLAAFLKHVPPTVYREARNSVFVEENGWSPARSFDLGSELYVSGLAALKQKEGECAAREALPASAFRSRYDWIKNIGGKVAMVQLVQDRLTGELFAAKRTLHWEQIVDMEREARAMQNLDHPNILPILKVYKEMSEELGCEQFIMVTPYIPHGVTLERMLEEKYRFSEQELILIGAQLLSATKHTFDKRLVHRDIKPSNIMITRNDDGSIKATLFDFGIVKFLGDVTRTASNGAGSIWWEAPEQIEGGKITTATDIHGIGLVLLSLALGRTRHSDIDRDQPVDVDIQRLKEMAAMGSFNNGFVNMIETMLARDPTTRLRVLSPSPLGERVRVRGSQNPVIPAEAGSQTPTIPAEVRIQSNSADMSDFGQRALAQFNELAESSKLEPWQRELRQRDWRILQVVGIGSVTLLGALTIFGASSSLFGIVGLTVTITMAVGAIIVNSGGFKTVKELFRSRRRAVSETPLPDLVLADLQETRELIDAETIAAVEEKRKKIEPPAALQ